MFGYRKGRSLAVALLLGVLAACGGGGGGGSGGSGAGSSSGSSGSEGVMPSLTALSPSSDTAAGPDFTLSVSGVGFDGASVVEWNGSARTTAYISSAQLTAKITAADVGNSGTAAVTVSNQASGGGVSQALSFSIQRAVESSLSSIFPSTVAAGGPAFTLTVLGSGFNTGSTVQWNGNARVTAYVSPVELTAQIAAADIADTGSAAVTVVSPGAAGGTSAALEVAVKVPSVDAVSFLINPEHSGAINFSSLSFPAAPVWTVTLGGLPSYALIANGMIFVTVSFPTSSGGLSGTELVALNQATGAVAWGPIPLSSLANAAYDNGMVFVVSDAVTGEPGLMQAFDASTGAQEWSVQLTGQYEFSSAPTALDGIVYTDGSGIAGTLYAVNESNGTIAWTEQVNNGASSTPAVTADGVYVVFPCWAYDFSPATGSSVWTDNSGCDGAGGGTPVAANGALYAPNGSGNSYSGQTFNAETGLPIGAYTADNPPAFTSTMGYFLQSGTLRGISLSTDSILWSFAGDSALVSSPIVVNQYVFIGSSKGNLYALDGSTGQQVWTVNLGAAIPAGAGLNAGLPLSGLSAGDGLLVVPAGNTLTAYTLTTSP